MRSLFILFLFTTSACSQSLNNSIINLQGTNQNVIINQYGMSHSAIINLNGDGINAIISQSGNLPQNLNFSVTCGSNCPSNPYIINQY